MEKDYQPKRQKSGEAQHFAELEQNRSQRHDHAPGRLPAPDLSTPEQDTPDRSSESPSNDLDAPGPSTKTATSNHASRRPLCPNEKPLEKSGRFGRTYYAIEHETSIYYLEFTMFDDKGKWKATYDIANLNAWDLSFHLDINYGTNSANGANNPPSIILNGRIIKGQDPHTKRYIYHPISCTWPASQIKNFKWKQQIGPPYEDNTIAEIWDACTDKANSMAGLYIIEWDCKTATLKGFEDGLVDRAFDRGDLRGKQHDTVDFMKAVAMNGGHLITLVPRDTFSESWERHTLQAMRNRLREGDRKDDIPLRTRESAPRLRTGDGPVDESHIIDMTGVDSPTTGTLSSAADSEDTEDSTAGADLEEPLRRGDALYDIDRNLVLLDGAVDAAANETEDGTTTTTEHVGRDTPSEPTPYPENNIDIDDVDAEEKGKIASSPGPLMSTAKKAMSALMGKGPFY